MVYQRALSAIVIKKGRRRVAFALSHSSNRLTLGLKGLALLVELDNLLQAGKAAFQRYDGFFVPETGCYDREARKYNTLRK